MYNVQFDHNGWQYFCSEFCMESLPTHLVRIWHVQYSQMPGNLLGKMIINMNCPKDSSKQLLLFKSQMCGFP